jgi:hypothetical protein
VDLAVGDVALKLVVTSDKACLMNASATNITCGAVIS